MLSLNTVFSGFLTCKTRAYCDKVECDRKKKGKTNTFEFLVCKNAK